MAAWCPDSGVIDPPMTQFDVFNGDADGICALHQLRLAEPADDAVLITGIKRDIELLGRVDAAAGDRVTVLDVSLDRNRTDLQRLLAAGARVFYVDHHYAGDIPAHAALETLIDTAPDSCTSLLVDAHLQGRYRAWAVAAAFGDNLHERARLAAEPLGVGARGLETLQALGTYINYNGYGTALDDLFFHPAELYRRLRPYADPFRFVAEDEAYRILADGYAGDMDRARAVAPERATPHGAIYVLPDTHWARRVSGVFANELAREHPARAHALLTRRPQGGYVVSVRAPLQRQDGADALCRRFPTGGGRKAAAGINNLPEDRFDAFAAAFVDGFR